MLGLFLLVFILFLFHRELLLGVVYFILRSPKKMLCGPWDLQLKARRKSSPVIFLHMTRLVESLSIPTFWASNIFVHEELWSLWADDEREAFLAWCTSANDRSSVVARIFFNSKTAVLDRDVNLLGASPLALTKALQKTISFREQKHTSTLGDWLSGLSFLGPSLFGDAPTHDERLKRIASYLAELQKER